jgi:hypothetical protein
MAQEQGYEIHADEVVAAAAAVPAIEALPAVMIPRRETAVDVDIQNQLDVVMAIIDENQDKMTDGEYLRAMNALGSLHKHKRTAFGARHAAGAALQGWMSFDDICDDDEIYEEVMELADNIVIELCGEGSSIYLDDDHNMVSRGEEDVVFDLVLNYKPEEGDAGYEASPGILHHALQMITSRIFKDTLHELDIVRPVSCPCGWRGAQGNWDRHIRNVRHQRWVAIREEHRIAAVRAASASVAAAASAAAAALENDEEYQLSLTYQRMMASASSSASSASSSAYRGGNVVAVLNSDVVYIDEEHWTPESEMRREELIADAVAAGKRIVYIHHTTTGPWRSVNV